MSGYSLCKVTTTVNDGSEPFVDYIIQAHSSGKFITIPELELFFNMDAATRLKRFNARISIRVANNRWKGGLEFNVRRILNTMTPTTVNEQLERLFAARVMGRGSAAALAVPLDRMQDTLNGMVARCEQYPQSCFLVLGASKGGPTTPLCMRSLLFSVILDKHYTKDEVIEARRAAPTETALVDRLAELLSDGLYAAVDRHNIKEGSANRVLVSA